MNTDVMFSNKSDEWQTPSNLYTKLDKVFHFKLDPCATENNSLKTERFYTKKDDGLNRYWGNASTFINPPYSQIKLWINKALMELQSRVNDIPLSKSYGDYTTVEPIVMLVPARVDTQWFHEVTRSDWVHVVFLKGRLKFVGAESSAPFPSCLIILSNPFRFFGEWNNLGCESFSTCYKLNLKR